jgi:hypothetical protein
MTTPRPWWASEGPVEGGVDPGQDPLLAHRAARRGPEPDRPDADGSDPDPDPGPDAEGPTAPPRGDPDALGRDPAAEICGVCPVCIAARMLGDTRPELLGHLTEAARHVTAALRSLLDTSADRDDGDRDHGRRDPGPADRGVRRIDLD